MKNLSNYTEESQTNLFNECGSFFAFGQNQFNEAKKDGVTYVSMGAGLICPKKNVQKMINGLDNINKSGIELDLKENGKKAIIHRELANHECQISMDITDCVDKLGDYPITKEEIQAEWKEYFKTCCDNDWF